MGGELITASQYTLGRTKLRSEAERRKAAIFCADDSLHLPVPESEVEADLLELLRMLGLTPADAEEDPS